MRTHIAVIVLLGVLAVSTVGCPSPESRLVGEWDCYNLPELVPITNHGTLTLDRDGTGFLDWDEPLGEELEITAWSLDGDEIHMTAVLWGTVEYQYSGVLETGGHRMSGTWTLAGLELGQWWAERD